MLKSLELTNVGPSPRITLGFGPRLNLLTGDNGLGKSFLLDIAWWALTRKWPAEINPKIQSGLMARPSVDGPGAIEFTFTGKSRQEHYRSSFDRQEQIWTGRAGRPSNPGLVLYAQVDGGFAVWDPARNYWRTKGNQDVQERIPAYVFSPREVWDGLRDDEGRQICNGLIYDWAGWQKEKGESFDKLASVIKTLSPSETELIQPGDLTRISLDDSRDIPTIRMPYGEPVPILHASAGIRRILSLAYLLVWSWQEHIQATKLIGGQKSSQIIFLIDEVESHLHPKWQRRIIPSLFDVMAGFGTDTDIQIITSTHSPLVLASVEPLYDQNKDAWFDLDLVDLNNGKGSGVEITKRPFIRHGDASNWLTSEAFDLHSARSLEAERVLNEATKAVKSENLDSQQAKLLDEELRRVLGDTDPFWIRWRYVAEKKGWLP